MPLMKCVQVDFLRINYYNAAAVGKANGFQSMQETGVVGSVGGRLDEYEVGKICLTGIGESRGKGCGMWFVGCIPGNGKAEWVCDVHVAVPCVGGYAGNGLGGDEAAKMAPVSLCRDECFKGKPSSRKRPLCWDDMPHLLSNAGFKEYETAAFRKQAKEPGR